MIISMQGVKVLHITDTLYSAGRQRVAVNLANLLQSNRYCSYLCTTRSEGPLEHHVGENVGRLRLARKRKFEISALRRLVAFIQTHQIALLHAHDASLFIAGMASLFPPYPVVVWHDHYGSYAENKRPVWLYRLGATRVSGIIAVSEGLAEWSRSRLRVPAERVWYLPNFVCDTERDRKSPALPGVAGSRIVCVANLRPEKDLLTLLRAMALVIQQVPSAHLLLVGSMRNFGYLDLVRREIAQLRLDHYVSLLGERQDVHAILRSCTIGVLSSAIEAFPLALLEYGAASLPTVATRVGQCAEILNNGRAGMLVPPSSPDQLAKALLALLRSPAQASVLGKQLQLWVQEVYSPSQVIEQIHRIYDAVLPSTKG